VAHARGIGGLSRRVCRDYFERRFTAPRMAQDYLAVYERLAGAAADETAAPRQRRRTPPPIAA